MRLILALVLRVLSKQLVLNAPSQPAQL